MRIMNKTFKRAGLFIGLVSISSILTYTLLLDENAKQTLKSASKNVMKDVKKLQEHFALLTGTVMEEDLVQMHQEEIQKQWENLGI